jgi:hypothetical protein
VSIGITMSITADGRSTMSVSKGTATIGMPKPTAPFTAAPKNTASAMKARSSDGALVRVS